MEDQDDYYTYVTWEFSAPGYYNFAGPEWLPEDDFFDPNILEDDYGYLYRDEYPQSNNMYCDQAASAADAGQCSEDRAVADVQTASQPDSTNDVSVVIPGPESVLAPVALPEELILQRSPTRHMISSPVPVRASPSMGAGSSLSSSGVAPGRERSPRVAVTGTLSAAKRQRPAASPSQSAYSGSPRAPQAPLFSSSAHGGSSGSSSRRGGGASPVPPTAHVHTPGHVDGMAIEEMTASPAGGARAPQMEPFATPSSSSSALASTWAVLGGTQHGHGRILSAPGMMTAAASPAASYTMDLPDVACVVREGEEEDSELMRAITAGVGALGLGQSHSSLAASRPPSAFRTVSPASTTTATPAGPGTAAAMAVFPPSPTPGPQAPGVVGVGVGSLDADDVPPTPAVFAHLLAARGAPLPLPLCAPIGVVDGAGESMAQEEVEQQQQAGGAQAEGEVPVVGRPMSELEAALAAQEEEAEAREQAEQAHGSVSSLEVAVNPPLPALPLPPVPSSAGVGPKAKGGAGHSLFKPTAASAARAAASTSKAAPSAPAHVQQVVHRQALPRTLVLPGAYMGPPAGSASTTVKERERPWAQQGTTRVAAAPPPPPPGGGASRPAVVAAPMGMGGTVAMVASACEAPPPPPPPSAGKRKAALIEERKARAQAEREAKEGRERAAREKAEAIRAESERLEAAAKEAKAGEERRVQERARAAAAAARAEAEARKAAKEVEAAERAAREGKEREAASAAARAKKAAEEEAMKAKIHAAHAAHAAQAKVAPPPTSGAVPFYNPHAVAAAAARTKPSVPVQSAAPTAPSSSMPKAAGSTVGPGMPSRRGPSGGASSAPAPSPRKVAARPRAPLEATVKHAVSASSSMAGRPVAPPRVPPAPTTTTAGLPAGIVASHTCVPAPVAPLSRQSIGSRGSSVKVPTVTVTAVPVVKSPRAAPTPLSSTTSAAAPTIPPSSTVSGSSPTLAPFQAAPVPARAPALLPTAPGGVDLAAIKERQRIRMAALQAGRANGTGTAEILLAAKRAAAEAAAASSTAGNSENVQPSMV